MTEMAEVQLAFQKALLSVEEMVPAGVVSESPEPARGMFGIYRNAYRIRIVESLGIDFPGLKRLLGESEFRALANEYLTANPSTYKSIRWVGSGLVDFAARSERYGDDPWPADMARLDWALAHAFDCPDLEPATLADLVSVPPEFWGSVRLIFHPSVRVFDVATPVAVVRPALLDDDATSVDRSVRKRGTIMTWRFGLDLKCREISALEAKAQRLMAEGNTFAEMCECIASMQPEHAAETAAQYLKGWLDWGAIGSLSHAATASS